MKKWLSAILCMVLILMAQQGAFADSDAAARCTGEDVVSFALCYTGASYSWGGETPEAGFDCSGFVYYVYSQFGLELNRTAAGLQYNGLEVNLWELRCGDVILLGNGNSYSHCGIYLGNGEVIHAYNEEQGVVVTPMSELPYENRMARRMLL